MTNSSTPTASEAPGHGLFAGYSIPTTSYDEVFSAPGLPRPHWATLIGALEHLGRPELTRRWENAKHLIRENAITYNIYGDPRGMDRPWELDTIPLMIAQEEWSRLEQGLTQRARLLNLILQDLYGKQLLLKRGLIPPFLVFANPSFLRPCFELAVPHNIHLHLCSTDLVRSCTGEWQALADRTQAPSGAGYALENRIVLSHTFQDLFREAQVHRLASFFSATRDMLIQLCPSHSDDPRVVLLTPGPYNETYFEHAYLARYLGFTLVEGGDLTVRDQRVYLKTLEGLQPVDVILRRIDDGYCDPLELRSESFLGVAGLAQVAREGKIAIANALGSGLVETAALSPYLPAICRELLGEDLRIQSAPTWWCGDAASRRYILEGLERVVLKPAFPSHAMEPVFGGSLSRPESEEWSARIRSSPNQFVAQEHIPLSTAPVWDGQTLLPRQFVLRTSLAWSPAGYHLMPGGLTRVSASADTSVVSMQRGGGSKDTWVLSSSPVDTFSLLAPPGQTVQLCRSSNDLPSRAADSLFWLGRYAERLEDKARLLRTVLLRLTGESPALLTPEADTLSAMLRCAGPVENVPEGSSPDDLLDWLDKELLALVYEEQRPDSLPDTSLRLRRSAASVRDRLSTDTLRILAELGSRVRPRRLTQSGDALGLLNRWIITLAAFRGMERENMTRSQGWRFLNIGRRMERSIHLIQLLRSLLVSHRREEGLLLEMLLEVADSSLTYRSRYFTFLQIEPVVDLLVLDDSNPRSLAYQMRALVDYFVNLPQRNDQPLIEEQRRIRFARQYLENVDARHLCHVNEKGIRWELEDLLTQLDKELRSMSDAISASYFSHARLRHLTGSTTRGSG